MAEPRDIWSKLEIVGKLISGVILVIIALYIDRGSEKIAQALSSGDLTQKLLEDLASTDSARTLRHEIALAALDQTVYAQNRELVLAVCERIIRNASYRGTDRIYAYEILRSRDSTRALALLHSIARSAPESSSVEAISAVAPPRDEVVQQIVQEIVDARTGNVVFVQFRGGIQRDVMQGLQQRLIAAGYNTPGIERVPGTYRSSVRYFHPQDAPLADSVAALTRAYFQARNESLDIAAADFTATKYKVPAGQIEVWIGQ